MCRALSRSVETVEDLEELERQEAEESKRQESESAAAQPIKDTAPKESFLDPSWVPRFVYLPLIILPDPNLLVQYFFC